MTVSGSHQKSSPQSWEIQIQVLSKDSTDGTGKSKQSATIAENTQISLLAFSPDGANKDNNKRAQSEV